MKIKEIISTDLESILLNENLKYSNLDNQSYELINPKKITNHFDFDLLESNKIIHLNTIKKTCINYRLRFLDINFFKGDLPIEAIDKLKNLEDIHNTRIDKLKIMAPSIMFRLKKTDDPILFAPIGNNYFYIIHKWGNDLNGLRKLRMWPFMSLTNLLITLLIISFLITLLTPLKVFTKTPDSSSFWLVFFFMFKGIVSIVLFLGVSLGKSFNPQIWNSKYNKV